MGINYISRQEYYPIISITYNFDILVTNQQ